MDAAFQSGFASALLDVLFTKVTDVVILEAKKFMHCDDSLSKLETTVLQAKELLNKVDSSDLQGINRSALQKRVDALTSLYYDADDLIGDLLLLMDSRSELHDKPLFKGILPSPRNWAKPRRIVKLQKKLDEILLDLNLLLDLASKESKVAQVDSGHKANLETPFFGREDEVAAITEELLSCTSGYQGVSIMGMSGLGKTTVALTIHNQTRIKEHFSVRFWVDIHDGCFNLEETIKQFDQHEAKEGNDSSCQGARSLLITFDNLLNIKLGDWFGLLTHVNKNKEDGKKYTNIKCLITTFKTVVVTNTRTSSHFLKPLCEEDCRQLIVYRAQAMNNNLQEAHVRNAAGLAMKCGGLPTIAHILGLCLGQYNIKDVLKLLSEDLWDSDIFQREILPTLKPCYAAIRSHLKQCLAYFSLFPPEYTFNDDELVHLWVGEGFINHSTGTSNLVEIAKDLFKEFLGMSVLRSSDQMANNGMPAYTVNPLGQKFAQLAASTTFLRFSKGVLISSNTRHLSFTGNNDCFVWDELKKLRHLRTFFAMCNSSFSPIPRNAFKKLKYLRVLSLKGSNVSKLPDNTSALEHLRYLDISHTSIKLLPETLCKLRDLQFLKLFKDNGALEYFPTNFENLTNMIYVDWEISDIRRMGLPSNIGKLSSLQSLPLFRVGKRTGHLISELENMNHLQGSILISNLENIVDGAIAETAALHKKSFEHVELEWNKAARNAQEVLTSLKPSQNLKKLTIRKYHGDAFPKWMTVSLLHLEEMHLHNCPRVQGLPKHSSLPDGMTDPFPNLKVLVFEKITNVKIVNYQFFGQGKFPKLESLELTYMDNLETWIMVPELEGMMPHLKVLKFGTCQKLTTVSSLQHLSSLEKLEIQRCGAWSSLPDLPGSLNHLIIIESVILEERCKAGCDDWQKVDCIKKVEIGKQIIQTSASKILDPAC